MPSLFAILTVLFHFAVFVSYCETDRLGTFFLFISIIIWSSVFIFGSVPLANMKRPTILFLNTLMLLFSMLSAALFMPQTDNVTVLDKIALGRYPSKADLYKGLLRLGIDFTPSKPPQKTGPVPP